MDKRRLGIALLFAIFVSLIVTSVIYVRTRSLRAANRVKTTTIVAAAVPLEAGVPITSDRLAEVQWPESVPIEGAIRNREEAIGRVPLYPVGAKEPLLQRELAAPGSLGLSAKIPDGMRAAAVKMNEVSNVAGFLFPGCRVDVLVNVRKDGNAIVTRTVLQNIEVLSTGTKTTVVADAKPEDVKVVTLLVTPEQSEHLFWAQQQAGIQFVLRNAGDQQKSNVPGITVAEMTGVKPAPEVAKPVHHAVKPVQAAYVVETLAGNKSTIAKF